MRSIMAVLSLEKQIHQYLPKLNTRQKRAVLSLVKGLVDGQEDGEYDEAFKRELDKRGKEMNQGVNVLSEQQMKNRERKLLKQRENQ